MRVAVAGTGSLAKYLVEELPKLGHDIVILTRSTAKPFFEGKHGVVAQRVTDYESVESIAQQIHDCDALVSTIVDFTPLVVTIHLNLLAACKQSAKCKRFIPAEFGGDIEDYPDQPAYAEALHAPVREAMLKETDVESTNVCVGFFMETYLPSANTHFTYFPPVIDPTTNTMSISGTGKEVHSITSARDVAVAVGHLLLAPKGSWRPHVFVEGHKSTQNHVFGRIKEVYGDVDTKVTKKSLTQIIKYAFGPEQQTIGAIFAQYGICLIAGATTLDDAKVARDRAQYFPNMRFRTIDEVLATLQKDPKAQL